MIFAYVLGWSPFGGGWWKGARSLGEFRRPHLSLSLSGLVWRGLVELTVEQQAEPTPDGSGIDTAFEFSLGVLSDEH